MKTVIETDRLILRATQMSDAEDIFEYASGKNVGVHAGWKPHETIQETRQIIQTVFSEDNVFAIVLKESRKVIGSIGLVADPKRAYDRVRMVGYALGETYWGRGYMSEAAKALIDYGFGTLDLVMISAYCYPSNERSRGVLKKLGFEYEGTLSLCEKSINGEVLGNECYALKKSVVAVNPERTDVLIDTLTAVWEASVRATHHFLTEQDVQKLVPIVSVGLSEIETLIVVYQDDRPIAFMGIDEDKIDMLFVAPNYLGKGIGKKLITLGIAQYGVRHVDVNEQNHKAAEFYRHLGFEVFERTKVDEQGHSFPLLKMKLRSFLIRQATPNDAATLIDLYRDTVLTVNRRDYSQAEVEDWASCGEVPKCKEMIKTHYFIVAETLQSQIVGFSSITPQGYLHSMFIHKDFQGKGVATMLLNEIERYAKERGITKITSEVSLTARPFFEKRGYAVETEQKRRANKLSLTNFCMVKS